MVLSRWPSRVTFLVFAGNPDVPFTTQKMCKAVYLCKSEKLPVLQSHIFYIVLYKSVMSLLIHLLPLLCNP